VQLPEHPDLQGDRDVRGHHQEPNAGVDTHPKRLVRQALYISERNGITVCGMYFSPILFTGLLYCTSCVVALYIQP
jgi:hypothetical protein